MSTNFSQTYLRTPFWLNNHEISVIEQALRSHQSVKDLNEKQQHKVAALLFSISYADKWAFRRKKLISRMVHWFLYRKTNFARRTISHIKGTDPLSLPFAIDHLVNQIGINKPASVIFTEYQTLPKPLPSSKRSHSINISNYISDSLEAYKYVFIDLELNL